MPLQLGLQNPFRAVPLAPLLRPSQFYVLDAIGYPQRNHAVFHLLSFALHAASVNPLNVKYFGP